LVGNRRLAISLFGAPVGGDAVGFYLRRQKRVPGLSDAIVR